MAKQIDAGGVVLEDLEWKDPKGKSWFIAGDIDTEEIVKFMHEWQDLGKNPGPEVLTGLSKLMKKLFATKHSEEELKELRFPAARIVHIAESIVGVIMGDLEGSVKGANPTPAPRAQRRQAARETAKQTKKKASGQ